MPRQPLFLGGSVKVNQRSEKYQFSLDMKVGRNDDVSAALVNLLGKCSKFEILMP